MGWLQLDPESLAARAAAAGPRARVPGAKSTAAIGAAGFALLALAGFAPWALWGRLLYLWIGEGGVYGLCAAVFILLSAPLLHWMLIGPGSFWRFYAVFAPAFCAYSAAWIGCWFAARGWKGGALGLLLGTGAMALIFAAAFEPWQNFPRVWLALFAANCAAYFGGQFAYEYALRPEHLPTEYPALKAIALAGLSWGLCFGVGAGLGLAAAFWLCQAKARALIAADANRKGGFAG
jgi:hypothetical protein